jgi:hypothetical protein
MSANSHELETSQREYEKLQETVSLLEKALLATKEIQFSLSGKSNFYRDQDGKLELDPTKTYTLRTDNFVWEGTISAYEEKITHPYFGTDDLKPLEALRRFIAAKQIELTDVTVKAADMLSSEAREKIQGLTEEAAKFLVDTDLTDKAAFVERCKLERDSIADFFTNKSAVLMYRADKDSIKITLQTLKYKWEEAERIKYERPDQYLSFVRTFTSLPEYIQLLEEIEVEKTGGWQYNIEGRVRYSGNSGMRYIWVIDTEGNLVAAQRSNLSRNGDGTLVWDRIPQTCFIAEWDKPDSSTGHSFMDYRNQTATSAQKVTMQNLMREVFAKWGYYSKYEFESTRNFWPVEIPRELLVLKGNESLTPAFVPEVAAVQEPAKQETPKAPELKKESIFTSKGDRYFQCECKNMIRVAKGEWNAAKVGESIAIVCNACPRVGHGVK